MRTMSMKVTSYQRMNIEICSIVSELKECQKNGRDVRYELNDDRVGFDIYIGIKKCISLNITFGKNEILSFHYMVYFPNATLINNVLSTAYESEFSKKLMEEILFTVYLLNKDEDYSVFTRAFLRRMNELELEYIKDNSNDIDNNKIDSYLPF